MAILQVRNIDDRLYLSLKTIAKLKNRSVSQEVIYIIEKYLSNPTLDGKNPTKEFIALSDSWKDDKTAEELIAEIKAGRKKGKRFQAKNVLFD